MNENYTIIWDDLKGKQVVEKFNAPKEGTYEFALNFTKKFKKDEGMTIAEIKKEFIKQFKKELEGIWG